VTSPYDFNSLFDEDPAKAFEAICLNDPDVLLNLLSLSIRKFAEKYDELHALLSELLYPPKKKVYPLWEEEPVYPSLRTLRAIIDAIQNEIYFPSSLKTLVKTTRRAWGMRTRSAENPEGRAAYRLAMDKASENYEPMKPRFSDTFVPFGGVPAQMTSDFAPWLPGGAVLELEVEGSTLNVTIPASRDASMLSNPVGFPLALYNTDQFAELDAAPPSGSYSFEIFPRTAGGISIVAQPTGLKLVTLTGGLISGFANAGTGDTVELDSGGPSDTSTIVRVLDDNNAEIIDPGGAGYTHLRLEARNILEFSYNGSPFSVPVLSGQNAAYYVGEINTATGATSAQDVGGTLRLLSLTVGGSVGVGELTGFYRAFGFSAERSEFGYRNNQLGLEVDGVPSISTLDPGVYTTPTDLIDEINLVTSGILAEDGGDSRIKISTITTGPAGSLRWVRANTSLPVVFDSERVIYGDWVHYRDIPSSLKESPLLDVSYYRSSLGPVSVDDNTYDSPESGTLHIKTTGIRHGDAGTVDIPIGKVAPGTLYDEKMVLVSKETGVTSHLAVIIGNLGLTGEAFGNTNTHPNALPGDLILGDHIAEVLEDGMITPPIPNELNGRIEIVHPALQDIRSFNFYSLPDVDVVSICERILNGRKGSERELLLKIVSEIPIGQTPTVRGNAAATAFVEELRERGLDAALDLLYMGDLTAMYKALVEDRGSYGVLAKEVATALMADLQPTSPAASGYRIKVTRDFNLETELQLDNEDS